MDGQDVVIDIAYSPLVDEKGKNIGAVAFAYDVTERKRMEEELRQSEGRLHNIIEKSVDSIVILDKKGVVRFVNPAAEALFGRKEEEFVGQRFEFPMVPDDIIEIEIPRKDRGIAVAEIRMVEIEWEGESSYLVSLRDITRRKRAEEALKSYASQLERSNRMKDLFMDIMRHDLLNPVGNIKSISGHMERHDFSYITSEKMENLNKMVRIIRGSAGRLEEMIQSASKLAKVENAEKLEFEEMDLASLVESAVGVLENLASQKGMRIINNIKGSYVAQVNPLMEDVFINFINNAIKYSSENTDVVIDIEDEGGAWKVMVKDHGPGVPDEAKEVIFDRFKRMEKGAIEGTGLGLAIVKRIADLHNGRVWVEDNPEGGSIFCVRISKVRGQG